MNTGNLLPHPYERGLTRFNEGYDVILTILNLPLLSTRLERANVTTVQAAKEK